MIDDSSEPGSWLRHWDSMPHTKTELLDEIRRLRLMNLELNNRIEQLEDAKRQWDISQR
ncbi:hypothetical protein UFOVP605_29 [uncultured Caudovirales phage]|uniref:Uncharacterized protein n=1 Tax=uncultured Caudovirales phage TaxID=2100421 RepID=A0A6J5N6P2_9CAUD|nr:hypothetical protein UFOVP605_29 [uncultured Caudovirales phage]